MLQDRVLENRLDVGRLVARQASQQFEQLSWKVVLSDERRDLETRAHHWQDLQHLGELPWQPPTTWYCPASSGNSGPALTSHVTKKYPRSRVLILLHGAPTTCAASARSSQESSCGCACFFIGDGELSSAPSAHCPVRRGSIAEHCFGPRLCIARAA